MTLAATPTGIPASLTLDSFNSTGSSLVVHGGFTNSVDTTTSGVPNSSTLTVQNGSTLTTGDFLNQSQVGLFGSDTSNYRNADANVNVLGGSTLNVDSLTTSTNNGFSNSNINITDSTLNVGAGGVHQGGTDPSHYSAGDDILTLTNSTVGVAGAFSNNNGLNVSNVNVVGSQLTVDGAFTQDQSNAGFGASSLNLSALDLGDGTSLGSTATVGGLTNSSLVFNSGLSDELPQSQVSIKGFSTLNILGDGTFTNINGSGVLSGGGYFLELGSTLNYVGSDITTLDDHTFLTLDNSQGVGASSPIMNNGHDGLSNSLSTINGHLILQNGAALTLTQQNLSVGSIGQINIGDNSTLLLQNSDPQGLTTLTNNGAITVGGSSQATLALNDDGSGSTFALAGTGTLTLADQGRIFGNWGDETLINGNGHTISGNGFIGNLNLINNGAITADGGNLILSPGSLGVISNSATGNMNVNSGATLTFQAPVPGASTTIINDGNINLYGNQLLPTGASDPLYGTATLAFDGGQFVAAGSPFQSANFTLSGSGIVNMNGPSAVITGVNGNENLTNDVFHTIQGAGLITNLFLTNNGTINALGGDLTIDLSAVNETDNFGTINVADGSSLTLRDTSGAGFSTIYNAGQISLNGVATDPALIFDSGGLDNTFTLTGGGGVAMSSSGTNEIYGASGHESLVNDFNNTISGGGTIHDFVAFTNNGTLESNAGSPLIVAASANLTNWSGGNNHLYGGNYVVDAGSTMQLEAIGAGQQIQTLNGASVTLSEPAARVRMASSTGFDGVTNAAAGISKIYSGGTGGASLTLNSLSGTTQLATDSNGRFTVASSDNNEFGEGSASLNLNSTSAAVAGDFVNRAKTYGEDGEAITELNLDSGSSLTIGSLQAPHDLSNTATTNGDSSRALALIDVTNGSTLTVNGNVSNTSVDNSSFGQSLAGAEISVDGSQLFVSGTFTNTGSLIFGDTSNGFAQIPGAILSLTGLSTATVGGLFTNDQNSGVFLDNQSIFGPGGASRAPGASASALLTSLTTSNGFSNAGVVILDNGSQLDNTGLFSNTGALAEIEIYGGSTLINHGAFTNSDGLSLRGWPGNHSPGPRNL